MRPLPFSFVHLHCRRAGFTLIELLIVICIISALAALGFGGLQKALNAGRIARSTQNLGQLAAANIMYATDNGVFVPADNKFNRKRWHGARTSTSAPFDPTKGLLAPYLGHSAQVTPCPLLLNMLKSKSSFEQGTGGYGYNAQYIGGKPGGAYEKTKDALRISQNLAAVEWVARTVMFTTTAYARADGLQEYPYCEPPSWDYGSGPSGDRPTPSVHFRANGRALVAWCDGHVSAESKNEASEGYNPHGGDAGKFDLGWFGPEAENGYWNPNRSSIEPE